MSCFCLIKKNILGLNYYVFIHNDGEFLQQGSRNALIPVNQLTYFNNINADISVNKFISDDELTCTDEQGVYDTCIKQEIEKLSKLCMLPFTEHDKATINETACSSDQEAQEALSIYQDVTNLCRDPCTQTRVDLHENAEYYLFNIANYIGGKFFGDQFGYYINLPQLIPSMEMTENYGFISVVADIGGLAGLFLGLSFLGLCSKLQGLQDNKLYNTIFKVLKWTLILSGLVCITYIIYIQFLKLQGDVRSSNILLDDHHFNLSISMCTLENAFFLTNARHNSTYQANLAEFWNNGTKLGNKIRKLSIHLENKAILTLFDEDSQLNLLSNLKNINRPRYTNFIEFCTTIDLNMFDGIKKIELIAKGELIFYVHYHGQYQFFVLPRTAPPPGVSHP